MGWRVEEHTVTNNPVMYPAHQVLNPMSTGSHPKENAMHLNSAITLQRENDKGTEACRNNFKTPDSFSQVWVIVMCAEEGILSVGVHLTQHGHLG